MNMALPHSLMAFCQAPQQFLLDLALKGPPAQFRLNDETFLVLSDPASIHAVLNGPFADFEKGALYDIPRTYWHDGIVTCEGGDWIEQHAMLSPLFTRRRLRDLEPLICERVARLIRTWSALPAGEPVDILAAANRIAFDVVATGLLGVADQTLADTLFATVREIDNAESVRLTYLIKSFGVTAGRFGRSARAEPVERMDRLTLAVADERLARATQPDDLFGAVMATPVFAAFTAERKRAFLAHQVATLLSAGYVTTGESIFWALYLLARHPAAQQRAREDIAANTGAMNGAPPMEPPPFLAAAFNESHRLYPPVWFMGRVALQDVRVGDLDIAAGVRVICSPYVLHRMPGLWPDSESYQPERFAPGAPPPPPRAFIPFGTGRRACLGRALAQMEMSAFIGMALSRFELEVVSEAPVVLAAAYTMHPKETVMFRLKPLT